MFFVSTLQDHEVTAIKYSVIRILSSLSTGSKGQHRSMKYVSVDLPLSREAFKKYFLHDDKGELSVKKVVELSHLDQAFGRQWNVVNFKDSSTRKRVFGLVLMHFRLKSLTKLVAHKTTR